MSGFTKRKATEEESEAMIKAYECLYEDVDYKAKEAQAVAEGMKAEVCSCGHCVPAFVDFVRCNHAICPLKSKKGKSLLDTLLGIEAPE